MAHTYEELRQMSVAQLREVAGGMEHEALQGHLAMNKEHLLPALCKVLGIDAHVHHHVVGVDKGKIKAEIRRLKGERDAGLHAHDRTALKRVRRKIHKLKRKLHKATV